MIATTEARTFASRAQQAIANVELFARQGWCKRADLSRTRYYLTVGSSDWRGSAWT